MKASFMKIAAIATCLTVSSSAMALQAGDKAPDVTVSSTSGVDVNLSTMTGTWKVVYFYPKSFTPGCTKQACGLRDHQSSLKDLGVTVIGVSTDSLKTQHEFKAKYELPFDLLADNDKALSKAFGVLGLMGFSKRVTFIISPEGVITDIIDDVSVESHDADVGKILKSRLEN
jgi:thioredoxin-dependent peroxiredoxin